MPEGLREVVEVMPVMTIEVEAALKRLLRIAGWDTGQSRRVANFLLAWHNAEENGGWDPTDLWAVDQAIADDMLALVGFIRHSVGKYPPDCGYREEIEAIWESWRLVEKKKK